jgi:hypothetical protein
MKFQPPNPNRIHRWDVATLLEALIVGSAIEFWAIAPLAYYQMGHAGPNGGLLGLLSFLLNLPGLMFFAWSSFLLGVDTSWAGTMAAIFLLQTPVLVYISFVLLRLMRSPSRSNVSDAPRRVVSPLAILSVPIALVCLGLTIKLAEMASSRLPEGCEDTVISQAVSPDGKYIATAFQRRCHSQLSTQAEVKEVPPHFWSAPTDPLPLLPAVAEWQTVSVRWEGLRHLVVVPPKREGVDTKVLYTDVFWKDVTIDYQ